MRAAFIGLALAGALLLGAGTAHADHAYDLASKMPPRLAVMWAVNWFGIGFYIDNFWWALLGSIVVSIVSFVLSQFVPTQRRAI